MATVLDTPAAISAWHFSSRMHQLAIEITTGMRQSRGGPILASMHAEGFLPVVLRSTKRNKIAVLAAMAEQMAEAYREAGTVYVPSPSILRALDS